LKVEGLRDVVMALRSLLTAASIVWLGRMFLFLPTRAEVFFWLLTIAILLHYLEKTVKEL